LSRQARQPAPQKRTVAHLKNQGFVFTFTDGSYTKGTRAHTHRELIREWLWEPREIPGIYLGALGWSRRRNPSGRLKRRLNLYKILFHFKALLWESTVLLLPLPTYKAYAIAILLHDHCAINAHPRTPPMYAIHHTILCMTISCKG